MSTVINRQFVENIPLNGRSFQSLITLSPGVEVVPSGGVGSSGEISVNGQRTEANYYTIDGISANTGATVSTAGYPGGGFAGATPQESALGTTQSIVSIDALEEFRASTSSYSAEYGRTLAVSSASALARGPTSTMARPSTSCATRTSMLQISLTPSSCQSGKMILVARWVAISRFRTSTTEWIRPSSSSLMKACG